MIISPALKILLPFACAWAESNERMILQDGVQLTESQKEDARKIGVKEPNRVRLLKVEKIFLPENPL